MKHPLLANPVRWLRGAQKRHSASLYDTSAYDTTTLASSPFAQALLATRQDILGKRFPIGNMIQMIVERKGHNNYEIVPVLEKPTKGTHPGSYVMNRALYIDFAQKRMFLPVPLKRRQRDLNIMNITKVVAKFNDVHREQLEGRIQLLMENRKKGTGPGLWAVPKSGETWLLWDGSIPQLHTSTVKEPVFLPYKENTALCLLVLKHARFCDYPKGT